MKCPNCGAELNESSAFCTNCGAKLETNQAPAESVQPPVNQEPAAPVESAAPEAPVQPPVNQVPNYGQIPDYGAPVPPTSKPIYKKPLFYILLVAIIAIIAGIVIGVTSIFGKAAPFDALENSIDAIYQESPLYTFLNQCENSEKFTGKIEVEVGKDITGFKDDIKLSSDIFMTDDNLKASVKLGSSTEEILDIAMFAHIGENFEGAFKSNLFGDTAYGIKLDENVVDSLKKSIFAPDSGSEYAMDEDSFNQIVENFEEVGNMTFDNGQLDKDLEELKDALKGVLKKHKETTKEKVELNGKTVTLQKNRYTLDEKTIDELSKVLIDFIKSHKGIANSLFSMTDETAEDLIAEIESAAEDFQAEDKTYLDLYVKGKYVCLAEISTADKNNSLKLILSEEPQKDGSFELVYKTNEDGEPSFTLKRDVTNSKDNYVSEYTIKSEEKCYNAKFDYSRNTKEATFTVTADDEKVCEIKFGLDTDNGLAFDLRKIDVPAEQDILVDKLNAIKVKFSLSYNFDENIELPEYKEMIKLKESDIQKIAEDVQSNLLPLQEKLSALVGDDSMNGIFGNLTPPVDGGDSELPSDISADEIFAGKYYYGKESGLAIKDLLTAKEEFLGYYNYDILEELEMGDPSDPERENVYQVNGRTIYVFESFYGNEIMNVSIYMCDKFGRTLNYDFIVEEGKLELSNICLGIYNTTNVYEFDEDDGCVVFDPLGDIVDIIQ